MNKIEKKKECVVLVNRYGSRLARKFESKLSENGDITCLFFLGTSSFYCPSFRKQKCFFAQKIWFNERTTNERKNEI